MRKPDANCANPAGDPDYSVTSADLKEIYKRRIEAAKLQNECAQKRATQVSEIIAQIQKQTE